MLKVTCTQSSAGFIITYDFAHEGIRPISFSFVNNCINPFNYHQLQLFGMGIINELKFTDNIYYTNHGNYLSLTYYEHNFNYTKTCKEIMEKLIKSFIEIKTNKLFYKTINNDTFQSKKNKSIKHKLDNDDINDNIINNPKILKTE
jgi:hypothetical protein